MTLILCFSAQGTPFPQNNVVFTAEPGVEYFIFLEFDPFEVPVPSEYCGNVTVTVTNEQGIVHRVLSSVINKYMQDCTPSVHIPWSAPTRG